MGRLSPTPDDSQASQAKSSAPHTDLHLLLPATQGNVDLCKTLLTAKILDFPTPGLLAWDETYNVPEQMAGGSHLAKIYRVLEYLETLAPSQDDDLVLMIDAYDIWFQLRFDVLVDRFHSMNAAANERLAQRLGRSLLESEHIEQNIIFGAGKRCAPNQLHSVACYTVPMSPLPDDLYGGNTDTVIGRNKYTSHRQRYLNSGYVLGRVKDVRVLFRRAAEEVKNTPDHNPELDNGSGGSDFLYHGSDQSIFNTLFGRQEYQREYLRQQSQKRQAAAARSECEQQMNSTACEELGKRNSATSNTQRRDLTLEGTHYSDPLNPPFTHELMGSMTDPSRENYELGIGLDYFSELGHQTANAENDGKWLRLAENPLNVDFPGKNRFDCPSRVEKESALADIAGADAPFPEDPDKKNSKWESLPLYTNLCTGKVPVMVHHNGDKGARGYRWPDMWYHADARQMLDRKLGHENAAKTAPGSSVNVIAWTDKNSELTWDGLCSAYSEEIFT